MGEQVHFLGLEATHTEVFSTLMGRDGTVVAARRDRITAVREEEGRYTARPAPWAREIGETARELIEDSGVPTSRIWGYAPAAPPGWICLDVQWSPMTDLFLVTEEFPGRIVEAIGRYLETDRRYRSRIGVILAPKDFLRFQWGKILATDPCDAANFGLLAARGGDWDGSLVTRHGLEAAWLPPVLPSTFACGRVGSAGMEVTSLPSSAWSAVGSTTLTARLAACSHVDSPALYVLAHTPRHAYWYAPRQGGNPAAAELPEILSAPLDALPPDACREDTPIILDWRDGEDPDPIMRWAAATGRPIFTAPWAGGISPGAAVLAALASGVYKSWESFYRRVPRPQELA